MASSELSLTRSSRTGLDLPALKAFCIAGIFDISNVMISLISRSNGPTSCSAMLRFYRLDSPTSPGG